MTAYSKRLIEVDLPTKHISDPARRKKSIRHGHISTLRIWRGRHPLAACHAVDLVRAKRHDLPVDGEMQADTAVVPQILEWRICFRWNDGDAYDVEIVDDH